MEERKRRTATKKAIAQFRSDNPSYTDAYMANIVQNTSPDAYDDNVEVAIEVLKEIYREQKPLTDETFVAQIKEMEKERKLLRYTKEEKKRCKVYEKSQTLINYIYSEAQKRDFLLSECPEWGDQEVREYFNERYTDKTLGQKFFSILNNKALAEKDMLSGYVLPFHCYTKSDNDVLFTRKSNGGCFGLIVLTIIFFITILTACTAPADPGIKNAEKYIRDQVKGTPQQNDIKSIKYERTDSIIALAQIQTQYLEVLRTQSYLVPTDTLNFILGQSIYHAYLLFNKQGNATDIIRKYQYMPRLRHRFTVTRKSGLTLTIDIIMDRDGLTPISTGREYQDELRKTYDQVLDTRYSMTDYYLFNGIY